MHVSSHPVALPLTPSLHPNLIGTSLLLWVSPTAREPLLHLAFHSLYVTVYGTLSGSPEFILAPFGISPSSQTPSGSHNLTNNGYKTSACPLMNSIGLRHDGYYEAQSVRFRYGSIPPAYRTIQLVTQWHGALGVGLVVSLYPSWTFTNKT